MTPAELKTLRESLGISCQWLANQAGVKVRTVQYWESNAPEIPKDVQALLTTLNDDIHSVVSASVELAMSARSQRAENPVVLLRYQTPGDLVRYGPDMRGLDLLAHGLMIGRVAEQLSRQGVRVRIVYFAHEPYEAWRGNREDSTALRAAWAALQVTA